MKTKNCENCGKEFSAQRNDARFCSSTCRSIAWSNSKEAVKEEDSFKSQLKGLVSSTQESKNPVPLIRKEIHIKQITHCTRQLLLFRLSKSNRCSPNTFPMLR
jgi:endogenous inhibitor of DNA gyrase (YacG/DUF329 family)